MNGLIAADAKPFKINQVSVGQAEDQLKRLADMAVKLGLTGLRTDNMRQAMSHWICHLLGKFPTDLRHSQLFCYYRQQLMRALFGVFGSTISYEVRLKHFFRRISFLFVRVCMIVIFGE